MSTLEGGRQAHMLGAGHGDLGLAGLSCLQGTHHLTST